MIRKHTRRAAKAAFAISLGVAIVIGLFAAAFARPAQSAAADDRHRHEELPRGVHPRPALQAGARGEGLHGLLQGEHRLDRAHPDRAHERQDQHVSRVHGRDRAGRLPPRTLAEDRGGDVRAREAARGGEGLHGAQRRRRSSTPTRSRCTNATAKKYGLKSIGDLKKVGGFKFGALPRVQDAQHVLRRATRSSTGSTKVTFVPLAGISPYAALDAGKVLAADVFSTDPPLGKGSKYTVLADPKHVTGFQNVAPIVEGVGRARARPEVHAAR